MPETHLLLHPYESASPDWTRGNLAFQLWSSFLPSLFLNAKYMKLWSLTLAKSHRKSPERISQESHLRLPSPLQSTKLSCKY